MSAETSTLPDLVAKYDGGIRIPMIQRDYAQGRTSWLNPRKRFLKDIRKALMPGGKPLHLDFVYGVQQEEDGIVAFSPLDGQQRLTTLFLLHWYLAVRDGRFDWFQNDFRSTAGASKFSYQVRPGGRSFFRSLVHYEPPPGGRFPGGSLSAWFREQSWFRTAWERDPSVAGALVMLDAIHKHFNASPETGYEQLAKGNRITFREFDLKAAGLHDDLYLRMNARGRSLSQFEPFKASYEKHLRQAFPESSALACCSIQFAKYLSNRLDNQWLDFIWDRYGPEGNSEDTDSFDAAFMNLFRAVALVSLPELEKKAAKENKDVESLRTGNPDYDDFENSGWLTPRFTLHLSHLLECLTGDQAERSLNLLGSRWFEESSLLNRVVRNDGQPTLTDCLQFAACVRFITRHGPLLDEASVAHFHAWIRVVRNLVVHSNVESATFRRLLVGLDELVEGSEDILTFLSESTNEIPGFNEDQVAEERLKARLIIADEKDWLPLIYQAEAHPYFRGQINFLLDFSGAIDRTDVNAEFCKYLDYANRMFGDNGLRDAPQGNDYLWQRALLAVGNYLLHYSGGRYSLLDPGRSGSVTWKDFLREHHGGKRRHLKDLWDRLEINSLEDSLYHILSFPGRESWRNVLCDTLAAWEACGHRLIHYQEREKGLSPRVFLLEISYRTHKTYEELNTFCFREAMNLSKNRTDTVSPQFSPLQYAGWGEESYSNHPHLKFEFAYKDKTHVFQLYCNCHNDTGFSLRIRNKGLQEDFADLLEKSGFVPESAPLWLGEHLVLQAESGTALDGAAFLKSIIDALKQAASQEPS